MLSRWALTKPVACSSVNMAASRRTVAGVGLGSPVDHRRARSKSADRPAGTTSRALQDRGPAEERLAAADSVAEGPGTQGSAAKGFATASCAAEGPATAGSTKGFATASSAATTGSATEDCATAGPAAGGLGGGGFASEGLAAAGVATGAAIGAAVSWHVAAISCQTGETAFSSSTPRIRKRIPCWCAMSRGPPATARRASGPQLPSATVANMW